MREIKFRGKRVDNGEWVYGCYFKDAVNNEDRSGFDYPAFIRTEYGDHFQDHEIIPETVGQYTGLKDDNSNEIYEGDILDSFYGQPFEVKHSINKGFEQMGHGAKAGRVSSGFNLVFDMLVKIGTIHDKEQA